MALAFDVRDGGFSSDLNYKLKRVDITFDDSYPEGGWEVAAADVGMDTAIFAMAINGAVAGYPIEVQSDGDDVLIVAYEDFATELTTVDALEDKVLRCIVMGY
jgi:hypothetical protein